MKIAGHYFFFPINVWKIIISGKILFFVLFAVLCLYCNSPKYSNPCDPSTETFRDSVFLKALLGDFSPHCSSGSNSSSNLSNQATPNILPLEGTYYKTQNISISTDNSSARICYTVDLSDPICSESNCGNGISYSEAFSISETSTVKAISCRSNANPSGISTSVYTIIPQYVYTTNETSDNVSLFKIDLTTGALTSLGSIAAGDGAFGIAASRTLGFVYVTNANANNLSMFSINKGIGTLNSLGLIGMSSGSLTRGLAVDPQNRYVYAVNNTGSIVNHYLVDQATGNLTSNNFTTSAGGLGGIAIDPQGEFVYSTQFSGNQVSQFTINQVNGLLNLNGSTACGTGPRGISIHPNGNFLYVANSSTNTVSMYSINRSNGVLIPNGTVITDNSPRSIAFSKNGDFAFITNNTPSTVSTATIDSTTGSLTVVSSVSTGTAPTSIAIDESGAFVYTVNNGNSTISAFSVNTTTGELSPIGSLPTGTSPNGIAVVAF
ncbi:beta-propeller fold lactonase family protein [Leptospira sp. GIMC2001]|uniref:beta-propeller fold lactonase family protein n=1 Tax=Leptospira sp. GIMC2001 TaxID=1513297 RepID=UPI00234AB1F5|nr:beta-propeller fold lactonase family protein [Leptospira sp. GIMC2001]WCL48755.1 beta-propeller fold lactonase family protein [Leptospira sp. GIMC2001]